MTTTRPRPIRSNPRERVDGVFLLDKPSGITSNAALQRVRRAFNALKAGHTGTLDPLASGLLPICLGEATKFAQVLLDARKEYIATVKFGDATNTGDSEGEVTARAPVAFDQAALLAALRSFMGASEQLPPRYAALKYEGRNLYEYARSGIEVPRTARPIEIDTLELLEHAGDRAVLRVGCSKGTYVRTLAEDIAGALGTVAHLTALRRTATGSFRLADAHGLDELEAAPPADRGDLLLPVDAGLAEMPRLPLDAGDARALLQGRQPVVPTGCSGRHRAYDDSGRFLCVVEASAGLARAVRLMADARLEAEI